MSPTATATLFQQQRFQFSKQALFVIIFNCSPISNAALNGKNWKMNENFCGRVEREKIPLARVFNGKETHEDKQDDYYNIYQISVSRFFRLYFLFISQSLPLLLVLLLASTQIAAHLPWFCCGSFFSCLGIIINQKFHS